MQPESDYIKYLGDLIGFKSISPASGGAMEYIADLLKQHGFSVEVKIFGNGPETTTNLYAVYGTQKPNICFAGHVDVVPAGNTALWQNDPFFMTLIGEKIYGRGAVDMKGAIACMLSASLEFLKATPNPKGSLGFLLTSDEEASGKYGTKEMLKYLSQSGRKIDFAIIGEPTCSQQIGDTIKIGRRGSVNFELMVKGTQGHVAYPHEADNPNRILIAILSELVHYKFDQGTEFFSATNLEVTSIDVDNKASNVIPAQSAAKFNVRFNNLHTGKDIELIVEKVAAKYAADYNLNTNISGEAFIQSEETLNKGWVKDFADIVASVTDTDCKLSTSGGTSDARFIKDYCPFAEFGLLYKTAHKVDEYTEISDLQKLRDVYYQSLYKFLG